MRWRDPLGHYWANAAMFAFFVSIAVGTMLPIYTDEIGWRLQERAAYDGGFDILVSDICGPNTIAKAPWFMMPTRLVSAAINRALPDPFYIRMTGVLFALAWSGVLLMLLRTLEENASNRQAIKASAFGLLSLGLLPLLLVMSRPEQPVVLAYSLIIIVPFIKYAFNSEATTAWLKALFIILAVDVAISFHLKGVLYAPIALASVALCSSGRKTLMPRVFGAITIASMTIASTFYWVDRLKCPADPILKAGLARENIAESIANNGHSINNYLSLLSGINPFNYVKLIFLTNSPMSYWIPVNRFSITTIYASTPIFIIIWCIPLAISLKKAFNFAITNKINSLREPRFTLAFAVLGCIFAWGASQLNRNVYEAMHILPMLVIFCALCFSLPGGEHDEDSRLRIFARVAAGGALVSTAIVLGSLAAPLAAAARTPGYVSGQPFSVSIAGYPQIRRNIDTAMRLAGIPTNHRLHRLLIDDTTYLALQDSYLPLHRLGVLSTFNGSISDPAAYLRSRQSDGVVIGCRYLPPKLLSAAARSGPICAISRDTLNHIK